MQPPRRVLMEAFRRQQERADEERNNTPGDGTLAITDGTNATERAPDSRNGLDDTATALVTTERGSNPSNPTQLLEASSRHNDTEDILPGDSTNGEPQQQQQTGGAGDDTANSGNGETAADPASDEPHVGTANTNNGDGDTEPGETARAAEPVVPRVSEYTGAVDAGSIGTSGEYNRMMNLGPWSRGYRVMEDDPKLQNLSRADELLLSVYGDTIHLNDGTHLDGGIGAAEDEKWQRWWLKVVSGDLKLWTPPRKHKTGKDVVIMFANEMQGVRLRKWNSERAMMFLPVILNRKSGVVKASAITKIIANRLELWKAGRYVELVNEVVSEARSGIAGRRPEKEVDGEVSESVACTFNPMILDGKLRAAVRFATERGLGGPLRPDDNCTKSGRLVLDVMKEKHPAITVPATNADGSVPGFDTYGVAPMTVPHTSDEENIGKAGAKMKGSAGPSGVDALLLLHLLIRFGTASERLREELALWSEWLSNESPPWAAIRALNAKRAGALDKVPGTRPLHVGEAIMRMLGKDQLRSAGDEAKDICIEGGIHATRATWTNDGWDVDFDPDPQSSFSRYARFLESEEETDDFVAWEELPEVEAEDDLAAVGNLSDCAMALEFLIEEGPKYSYFPEP
eukprot:scaffold54612_cov72-Cyclotella_meneghiniana.AAC.3